MHSRRAVVMWPPSAEPREHHVHAVQIESVLVVTLATSARSFRFKTKRHLLRAHSTKNPSAGQQAAQATHLCNEHAVLELGVGGDLLPQLGVLGHQALAVAAPCVQDRAWQSGGKHSCTSSCTSPPDAPLVCAGQRSAVETRPAAAGRPGTQAGRCSSAAAVRQCMPKGCKADSRGCVRRSPRSSMERGRGLVSRIAAPRTKPPSPSCNTLFPLTGRVELQGEDERREAASEQQAANECGHGRPLHARAMHGCVAHSTHLNQRRPLAVVHSIEVVGCCGARGSVLWCERKVCGRQAAAVRRRGVRRRCRFEELRPGLLPQIPVSALGAAAIPLWGGRLRRPKPRCSVPSRAGAGAGLARINYTRSKF